jgi:hypothetical protein
MDRQEIAMCLAPRLLCVHYGELDRPSPDNFSAAYNETAETAYKEVAKFYQYFEAPMCQRVQDEALCKRSLSLKVKTLQSFGTLETAN